MNPLRLATGPIDTLSSGKVEGEWGEDTMTTQSQTALIAEQDKVTPIFDQIEKAEVRYRQGRLESRPQETRHN